MENKTALQVVRDIRFWLVVISLTFLVVKVGLI